VKLTLGRVSFPRLRVLSNRASNSTTSPHLQNEYARHGARCFPPRPTVDPRHRRVGPGPSLPFSRVMGEAKCARSSEACLSTPDASPSFPSLVRARHGPREQGKRTHRNTRTRREGGTSTSTRTEMENAKGRFRPKKVNLQSSCPAHPQKFSKSSQKKFPQKRNTIIQILQSSIRALAVGSTTTYMYNKLTNKLINNLLLLLPFPLLVLRVSERICIYVYMCVSAVE
jgi:hypothetical protein